MLLQCFPSCSSKVNKTLEIVVARATLAGIDFADAKVRAANDRSQRKVFPVWMNCVTKLCATTGLMPVALPSGTVGSNVFCLVLKSKRMDERPRPRFHSDCRKMLLFRTFPALILLSSACNVASKASGPHSVMYAVRLSTCKGFSNPSQVWNKTSLFAGPSSRAVCHISSSGSSDGVSMDKEDLSRSSSSGRGPNSNVSRSGSRSSRSSSCLGAYGWPNLIDETIYGQLNSTRSGRKHATNSLSSCRGANRVDSNGSESAKSVDRFHSWPLEKTSSTDASPSMAVEVWRWQLWWGMTPKFPAAPQPYADPWACRHRSCSASRPLSQSAFTSPLHLILSYNASTKESKSQCSLNAAWRYAATDTSSFGAGQFPR
jgi:hypothetical protein